jgi:hypothetical protein
MFEVGGSGEKANESIVGFSASVMRDLGPGHHVILKINIERIL